VKTQTRYSSMTTDMNRDLITKFFEQVLNGRRLSILGDFISGDYIEHSPTDGQKAGLEGVQQHIEAFFTAFSNTRYNLEDTIAEGNKVVAKWTLTGKHTGNFLGIAPAGKPMKMTGIDIYYIEDGRISEHWHEFDLFGLMAQLTLGK